MENRLKNELVGLIAAGVMVKRSSINVLHPSPKYIEKTVSQLYSDGVIRRAPGKVLRLTPRGISLLDEDERQLYMALSCGNRPGNDKSHVDAATRASDCLAVMYAAGIPAGFYKNEFEFKNDSVEPSYKTSFEFKSVEPSEFVLKKELMEPGQRQRRMDGSRASGYLFASGIAATVISTMGRNLKLNHRGEFSDTIHCTVEAKHRFSGIAYTGDRKYQCIILCPSDDDCLRILSHRTEAHTLAGEVCDKHQSNIEYRYIPATPDGVRSLRYIAAHTQDDILHAVFSDEEIAAAYGKDCDAVTSDVRAVEFCSCNLSKLMRYAGRDDIGVVCFEWQYDFVRQLWGGCINLRRILRDSMI